MSPLPTRMVDRWADRPEPGPGEGVLYWHVLLGMNPDVRALAHLAQEKLESIPGLHLVPLDHLHMTVLAVGPTDDLAEDVTDALVAEAGRRLEGLGPIAVQLGRLLFHPMAVMLAVRPTDALLPVFKSICDATRHVTGRDAVLEHEPWTPHVTLAYSEADQPAGPIVAALGRELPGCEVAVSAVNLVEQQGPEREWDWQTVGEVRLSSGQQA